MGNGGCSRWSQSVNLGRFANEKIGERKRNGRKNTQAWPSEKSDNPKRFARGQNNPNRTFGNCRESKERRHADKRLVPAVGKTSVIRPRLSTEETGYLRTLSGMANNLNQLTKLAHKGGLLSLMGSLRSLLNEVERLMERIGKDDS